MPESHCACYSDLTYSGRSAELHVSLRAEQEINGLAGAVDRTIKVASAAVDLDVCLINMPRTATWPEVRAYARLNLGSESLGPAIQGYVVDLDATVGHHEFQITEADRELEIPPHRPENYVRREAEATKQPTGIIRALHEILSIPSGPRIPLNATEPMTQSTQVAPAATRPLAELRVTISRFSGAGPATRASHRFTVIPASAVFI